MIMASAPAYSDYTFSDPNPIKRVLQRSRLSHAMKLARTVHSPRAILDFGAGNGELCKLLRAAYPDARIFCYEPSAALMQEARRNLACIDGIEFASASDAIEPGSADIIFCLEVFEHLPAKQTVDAFSSIAAALSQRGRLIIGVPIEIGIPALYKGVFRMSRRYGAFDATLTNVLFCVAGRPPYRRPLCDAGDGLPYYAHHVGFDHRRFRSKLSKNFHIEAASPAPTPMLGAMNPEIYFLCRHRH